MRFSAFAAAVIAAALTAGPAAAKDLCVGAGASCSSSVQEAVDAAAASPGDDRVLVGPGAWAESEVVTSDVEIEGSGASTEIIGSPAIRAQGGSVAVRRARLVGTARRDLGAVEAVGSCQVQRHRTLGLRYVRRNGRYALRVRLTPR